ncbi:unnamed protein product [Parascedosporium putredinis]|uniref:lytic cellulose monooxygenase (C4-dehydrogenating) n=1 Tax=Parascedosporium putredinis TaxID=1442378 RepID=A0A9P1H8H5_9PEZI|nr:unnamed protein product [Parascedosporium putredinis]CAI7999797.1 unnamed protein product [Parascedosporium putredinis]
MPSLSITAAAAALLSAATVAAHGHVTHVITSDGVEHQGWDPSSGMGYGNNFPDVVGWTTTVQDNGFISKESHANAEMACHRGATPAALSVTVQAGDVLTLAWDTWPAELSWFKISEVGNVTPGTGDNGVWGADLLLNNGVKWQVQIPDFVTPGEYVLRHEIIALHSLGEPQHYPQCINLVIEAMIQGVSPILDQGSGAPAPGSGSGGDDSGNGDNGSDDGSDSGSDNGSTPTEPAPSATATPTIPVPGNNAEEPAEEPVEVPAETEALPRPRLPAGLAAAVAAADPTTK